MADHRPTPAGVLVTCPYCGATDVTDPYWMTPREMLRSHWYGACKSLPWWRRWFGR